VEKMSVNIESELDDLVEHMKRKFVEEKQYEKLRDLSKRLIVEFSDIDISYCLSFNDGKLQDVTKGKSFQDDDNSIRITTTSKAFLAVIRKEMSPMSAAMNGLLSVKGSYSDLAKLLKVL